jgi:hypothetical protein
LFLSGVLSGAYMQLFFRRRGELHRHRARYVAVYVLRRGGSLSRESPLWMPAAALATAICFHLEAGWLLPSALYLAIVSRSRTGNLREATRGAVVGGGIIALVFLAFHVYGLPLWRFFSSHAGHACAETGVFAIGMPREYYVDQVRLLLWLCPAALLLLPFAIQASLVGRRGFALSRRRRGVDAGVSSGGGWRPTASSTIGISTRSAGCSSRCACGDMRAAAASTRAMQLAAAVLAVAGALNTYTWIIANHAAVR